MSRKQKLLAYFGRKEKKYTFLAISKKPKDSVPVERIIELKIFINQKDASLQCTQINISDIIAESNDNIFTDTKLHLKFNSQLSIEFKFKQDIQFFINHINQIINKL